MGKKLTLEDFVKKAKEIHNDKYRYDLVDYIGSKIKVKIICPIHGVFEQEPRLHLSGNGCKMCANDNLFSNKNRFIESAIKIHNNKYDYSLVNYINNETKVKIICEKHGIFEQKPKHHLYNCGCTECMKDKLRKNEKEYISECIKIHNNIYDYSKVKYINNKSKIIITCKIHGNFYQVSRSHLLGHGCPHCKESNGEKEIIKYFKLYNISYIRQKKFDDCKGIKNKLPFDFYLPDYNICIEFDGIQHFKPLKFFGGKKTFVERQKTDSIKNIYCKQNNITLLRIKYNENIIEKLNENIKIQ